MHFESSSHCIPPSPSAQTGVPLFAFVVILSERHNVPQNMPSLTMFVARPGLDGRDVAFVERLRSLAREALTWEHLSDEQRLVWAAALEFDAVPVQETGVGGRGCSFSIIFWVLLCSYAVVLYHVECRRVSHPRSSTFA